MREGMKTRGIPVDSMDNDAIRGLMKMMGEGFRDNAPVTAAQAATIILDGVKSGEWRILVGDDAHKLDEAVRADPKGVYGTTGFGLSSITGNLQPE